MNTPVVIRHANSRLLLGLVRVEHLIEDRRPDAPAGWPRRYKHQITLRTPLRRLSWVFHTAEPYGGLPYEG